MIIDSNIQLLESGVRNHCGDAIKKLINKFKVNYNPST